MRGREVLSGRVFDSNAVFGALHECMDDVCGGLGVQSCVCDLVS